MPKADWRLLVIFHRMCVCVYLCVCVRARLCALCVCDCSRKCRLKRGRWRQMGEVGGRCSEKTWKSTPPPPPLARPQALLARPRVKITQFARSQVTEMQSSRDKTEKGGMGVEDRGRWEGRENISGLQEWNSDSSCVCRQWKGQMRSE